MLALVLLAFFIPAALGQNAVGIARIQPTIPALSKLSGSLIFTQMTNGNVTILGTISGLPPNTVHALHIHEYGDITGGLAHPERMGHHFNPLNTPHGLVPDPSVPVIPPAVPVLATPSMRQVMPASTSRLMTARPSIPRAVLPSFQTEPRHVGDIGNIKADSTGTATVDMTRDLMTLTDPTTSILGRGVALHLLEDRGSRFQPAGGADGIIASGVVGLANTPENTATSTDQPQISCLLQGTQNLPISGQMAITPGCITNQMSMKVQAVIMGLEQGTYSLHVMTAGDLVQGLGGVFNPLPSPSNLPCHPTHEGDFGTLESTNPNTPALLEHYYPLPSTGLATYIGHGCALFSGTDTTATPVAVGVLGVANDAAAPPDTSAGTPVSCLPVTPTPSSASDMMLIETIDDMEIDAPVSSRMRLPLSLGARSHASPFFTAVPRVSRMGCDPVALP